MISAEQNRKVIKMMECLSHWSSKRQSDGEHANWTGVAKVRSSSGFLWSYHKISYWKIQRILLMAVSHHYNFHETFDDLTVFFLKIQFFWDMKHCCSFETSRNTHPTTRRHLPEEVNPQLSPSASVLKHRSATVSVKHLKSVALTS